jgi:hypothetical protein
LPSWSIKEGECTQELTGRQKGICKNEDQAFSCGYFLGIKDYDLLAVVIVIGRIIG